MKSTDVLTLLNAGFTREEILAMDADPGDAPDHSSVLLSAETAQPSDSPSSQPAEAVPSSPAVEQEAAQEAPPDPTQQILQQLTELVRSVQANNRSSADMGANIIEPKQQALSTLRSLGGMPENQD